MTKQLMAGQESCCCQISRHERVVNPAPEFEYGNYLSAEALPLENYSHSRNLVFTGVQ